MLAIVSAGRDLIELFVACHHMVLHAMVRCWGRARTFIVHCLFRARGFKCFGWDNLLVVACAFMPSLGMSTKQETMIYTCVVARVDVISHLKYASIFFFTMRSNLVFTNCPSVNKGLQV